MEVCVLTKPLTGVLHGRTITLETDVPPLNGQRVRVVLAPVEDPEAEVSSETQAELWNQWVARGPDGPIADDEETEFP
jgi:hypothetical protein